MLQQLEAILLDPDQEVCPAWRVCRIPKRLAFRTRTAIKGNPVIDILDRKNRRIRILPCRFTADCRVVIQDPNATAKSADYQVILTCLNLQVTHRNRRDAADFMPSLAFIRRNVETRLRSDKEQLWIDMILHNRQCWRRVREVARDRFPCFTLIGALHDIRLVVTIFMVVKERVDGVCGIPRCQNPANVCPFRNVRDLVQLAPSLAAIRGDVKQAIIRAGVN